MESVKKVGVLGLGIMGSAMSSNLVKAGFEVIGYDLLAERRDALKRAGGKPARSVADVAARADVVISSLPSAAALDAVVGEFAAKGRRDQIIIETSTLPLKVKEDARARLTRRGVILLDCPLSGTGAQARTKDLSVYASGMRNAYRRCVPVFEGFSRTNYYLGAFGAGSKMKYIANLLVAIHNVSSAEAVVMGIKAGLDPALVVKVVGDGAGSSRMLQVRGPMMAKNDYSDVGMKCDVWQKDMQIIGDYAREIDCPTPLFASTFSVYNAAMALGYDGLDTAAVCAVLEKWAGTGRPAPRIKRKR